MEYGSIGLMFITTGSQTTSMTPIGVDPDGTMGFGLIQSPILMTIGDTTATMVQATTAAIAALYTIAKNTGASGTINTIRKTRASLKSRNLPAAVDLLIVKI